MPCFHCQRSLAAVIENRFKAVPGDKPFRMTRTMGASGAELRPEGHGAGLICGSCGVVFFPPIVEGKDG